MLQNKELVYGKFFEKKAGFISLKLWPDFCNYRRDGYDFDARSDDGLAPYKDKGHDFSLSDHGLQDKITHLLYHLKDNKGNVLGVLSGESGELFMRYFKEYLITMFEQYPPREFALNYLVGSLAGAAQLLSCSFCHYFIVGIKVFRGYKKIL